MVSTSRRKYNVRVRRRGHLTLRILRGLYRGVKYLLWTSWRNKRGPIRRRARIFICWWTPRRARIFICWWTPPFGHEYEYIGGDDSSLYSYHKLGCIFCDKRVRWQISGIRHETIKRARDEYKEAQNAERDRKKKMRDEFRYEDQG